VRALLPWMALLAFIPPAHPASPAQVLQACSKAELPTAPNGIEGLSARCPELEQALIDMGMADELGADWRGKINRTAVRGLAQLTQRYEGEPPGSAPDIAALPQVMQALQLRGTPHSWWDEFKAWLRAWLRSPDSQNTGWLARLLLHLKLPPMLPSLTSLLGYATIALVLVMAAWIVWRELKAAGVIAPRPPRVAGTAPRRPTTPADPGMELPDLEALPLWQRPAVLLAALVQVLRQTGRLGLERALTHRQLVERGRFNDDAQRARFQRISLLAERQLYGVDTSAPSAQVLTDGVDLYRALRAGAGGRR